MVRRGVEVSDPTMWVRRLGILLAILATSFGTHWNTQAIAAYPAWGTLLASLPIENGKTVGVYSNGASGSTTAVNDTYGGKYQCVELVQRYFAQRWGYPNIWPGPDASGRPRSTVQHAWEMLENHPVGTTAIWNGNAPGPQPGDALVFNRSTAFADPSGHVGVVTQVANGRVTFAEQNSSATGYGSVSISGNSLGNYGSYSVRGWVHAERNGNRAISDDYESEYTWVGRNSDGRIEVSLRGDSTEYYHQWETAPGSGTFSHWQSLSGSWPRSPVLARNAEGYLVAFGVGNSKELYARSQLPGGGWGPWQTMGGQWNTQPAIASDSNGLLNIFLVGTSGELYVRRQLQSGGWGAWEGRGGLWPNNPQPTVGRQADGRLVVAMIGQTREIYVSSQTSPGSAYWTGWSSLGGAWSGKPAMVRQSDGTLSLFAAGDSGELYENRQFAPNSANWGTWATRGGYWPGRRPIAGRDGSGRISIFLVGKTGELYSTTQLSPSGGSWTAWRSAGGAWPGTPSVVSDANGRLRVFAVGTSRQLYSAVQSSSGSASWGPWSSHGGAWAQP